MVKCTIVCIQAFVFKLLIFFNQDRLECSISGIPSLGYALQLFRKKFVVNLCFIHADKLLKPISYEGQVNSSTCDYSKLLVRCDQSGYARSLRLQNVHCTAETFHLLRESKLESLVIRKINTKMQVSNFSTGRVINKIALDEGNLRIGF